MGVQAIDKSRHGLNLRSLACRIIGNYLRQCMDPVTWVMDTFTVGLEALVVVARKETA